MTRTTRFPHCMTLRIDRQMDNDLEDLAYDHHRLSKAATIRRILAKAIAESHQNVIAISKTEDLGGAL